MIGMRQPAREECWTLCDGLRLMQENDGAIVSGGHLDHKVRLADGVRQIGPGKFELCGRDTDLIKIGGKRASLAALTHALNAVAGVVEGAFYVPEELKGNGRLAAVAVAPGLTAQAIVSALREHIDAVFLPRPLILVTELPRTIVGKVARDGLRELVLRHRTSQGK
jgi:acyl-coenzyme A synthetase/AMP-(fatty) acid ligase